MPTNLYALKPCDVDPRRWEQCRRAAEAEIRARGIFDSHRRHHDLVMRAAHRRFAEGAR